MGTVDAIKPANNGAGGTPPKKPMPIEQLASIAPRPKAQETGQGANGGGSRTARAGAREQASPPISGSALNFELMGIKILDVNKDGKIDDADVKQTLKDRKLDKKVNISDGLQWEEVEALAKSYGVHIFRNYFDTLSVGGTGIEGDGKFDVADAAKFDARVIKRLAQGCGKREEVIREYMAIESFKMVDVGEAVREFRGNYYGKENIYTGEDVSASKLLDVCVSPGLRDLAQYVLRNIKGKDVIVDGKVVEGLKLNSNELQTFLLSMYFLGKVDNPEQVLGVKVERNTPFKGSTVNEFLVWLSKEAKKPVEEKAEGKESDSKGTEALQKLLQEAQDAQYALKFDEAVKKLEQAFESTTDEDQKVKIARSLKQAYDAQIESLKNAGSAKLDDAVKAYEGFLDKIEKMEIQNDTQKGALLELSQESRFSLASIYIESPIVEERLKAVKMLDKLPESYKYKGNTKAKIMKQFQMQALQHPELNDVPDDPKKAILKLEEHLTKYQGPDALWAHIKLYEAYFNTFNTTYHKKKYKEAVIELTKCLEHIKQALLIMKELPIDQKTILSSAVDDLTDGIKKTIDQFADISKQASKIPGVENQGVRDEIRKIAKDAEGLKQQMESPKEEAKKAVPPKPNARKPKQKDASAGKPSEKTTPGKPDTAKLAKALEDSK